MRPEPVLSTLAPLGERLTPLAERLRETERRGPRFFRLLSGLLLLIVFLGFAKSFFFRPAFENFPVAPIVIIHGGVMSLWFVVYAAQTWLARAGRIALHRVLGFGSFALAAGIFATAIPTTYGFPARRLAAEVPGYDFAADLAHITMVVHGNTAMLIQFVLLYGAGIALRRVAGAHKRLMSLAAIALVTPAASRLLTVIGEAGVTSELLGIASAFGLPLSVVAYDLVMDRRVHRATIFGVALIFGSLAILGLIGKSPIGPKIALWLAGA
ncbi:MAG: hypothetical protein AAF830_16805 [Pseudomonadota bacterium]